MAVPTNVTSTLHRLLDENARFALDARGTTNHCPMALVALAQMGAPERRLQEFFDRWNEKFAIPETAPALAVTSESWLSMLGNPAAFGSLRRYFSEAIGARGAASVIREVLGEAPLAPATGAFHALIRLAYGLEADHAGEIAAGLAAYVAGSLPCDIDFNGRAAAVTVRAGLATLHQRLPGRTWPSPAITDKLRAVAADADFCDALPARPIMPALLDDLASAAIELYWQTADFTVLHMVTGVHAARIVLATLHGESAPAMLPALWTAFCAAYVSVGAPLLVAGRAAPARCEWSDVLQRATESNDDHQVKMAWTCFAEGRRTGNPLYLASAARILRLDAN